MSDTKNPYQLVLDALLARKPYGLLAAVAWERAGDTLDRTVGPCGCLFGTINQGHVGSTFTAAARTWDWQVARGEARDFLDQMRLRADLAAMMDRPHEYVSRVRFFEWLQAQEISAEVVNELEHFNDNYYPRNEAPDDLLTDEDFTAVYAERQARLAGVIEYLKARVLRWQDKHQASEPST